VGEPCSQVGICPAFGKDTVVNDHLLIGASMLGVRIFEEVRV